MKVLRIDRPDGRRVLKFDGPSGRGLRYRPQGDEYKVSVTDLLSVSYDMLPTVQGGGTSHQKGKTPKWYVKYMTRCFFPHISRFPLRGSPAKRERVYGFEQGYDTLSFS